MDKTAEGWTSGFIGMVIFSGSLPATRAAVMGFDPIFLTAARAALAGAIGLSLLMILRQPRPAREDLLSLGLVSLGVVVGFPLLTAVALQHMPSARSLIFIGLLPLSTALFGVLRAGDRPRPAFWIFALLGASLVAGYAAFSSGSEGGSFGDGLMLAAIALCGLGYAEGGRLSRRLGGWQVISWALALSLPISLSVALALAPEGFSGIAPASWVGLGYVSLFSMLIGFVFWYRGLALGGVAAVGQLQLLQPFFGLALAALLLNEQVGWAMLAVTLGVVACVAGAKRFA